ncbi:unnamed protein product [Paramecium sonneborni]|uniref:Uncharacterized protein n=1 Tax=Paramecium sonneborni TaxID=65129 RepID=A0A8S1LBC2_9CILI|nr:unnamed protein product [Paramecium sonneborni]
MLDNKLYNIVLVQKRLYEYWKRNVIEMLQIIIKWVEQRIEIGELFKQYN